jgi:hypothetical protein
MQRDSALPYISENFLDRSIGVCVEHLELSCPPVFVPERDEQTAALINSAQLVLSPTALGKCPAWHSCLVS